MYRKFLILCFLFCLGLSNAYGEDGRPLTKAHVLTVIESHDGGVGGVSIDQLGYVYIGDFHEHVWRLDPVSNQITSYFSGLYGASGNTFDRNGNLYHANFYGDSISRIARSGEVTTVLSEGLGGPVGIVFDADNNLLICNCSDQTIGKLTPDGKLSVFAKSDHFSCPNGITKNDQGDFFVVSFSSPKIIRITPDGEVSVFANTGGNGVGHIVFLRGVFFATSFIDNKIYRITGQGKVSLFSGTGERSVKDGVVEEAAFSNPNGIAADPTGRFLYINDYIGDESASGIAMSPFSVRRIELPRLHKIVAYELDNRSSDAAITAYESYRNDPANRGENTEAEINSLGWTYLLKNQYEKAVFIFELNATSYAESWSAFSSLGAAYLRYGKDKPAIKALRRSLELNPDNTRAAARLKKLGGDN